MIREEPKWVYRREAGLNQYYSNVEMFGERVIGSWFCVDAETGEALWERDMGSPNMVCDVWDGVIVATEFVIDGPTSYSRGIFGLSLETGETLWQADDPPAGGGVIARFFHRIGLLSAMDAPVLVAEGEVHCRSGRFLDTRDGAELRAQGARKKQDVERTRSEQFYDNLVITLESAEGRFISARRPGGDPVKRSGSPLFYGVNSNRVDDWQFSLAELGYSTFSNFFSQRLVGDEVYLFGKEGPYHEPTEEKHVVRERVAPVHLIVVDGVTGDVTQDFTLPEPAHEYRIDSVSEAGLLVSHSNTWLALYPFA